MEKNKGSVFDVAVGALFAASVLGAPERALHLRKAPPRRGFYLLRDFPLRVRRAHRKACYPTPERPCCR